MTTDIKLYDIEYLLDRAYNSFTVQKGKVRLVKPDIQNKDRKSYIINFTDFCISINRSTLIVQKHIERGLQIPTSIKENGSLKIDKAIKSITIQNAIKNYIEDHIMCKTCKSVKTVIEKQDRIDYLICNTCKCKIAINN